MWLTSLAKVSVWTCISINIMDTPLQLRIVWRVGPRIRLPEFHPSNVARSGCVTCRLSSTMPHCILRPGHCKNSCRHWYAVHSESQRNYSTWCKTIQITTMVWSSRMISPEDLEDLEDWITIRNSGSINQGPRTYTKLISTSCSILNIWSSQLGACVAWLERKSCFVL